MLSNVLVWPMRELVMPGEQLTCFRGRIKVASAGLAWLNHNTVSFLDYTKRRLLPHAGTA
jgi:hypothetical protein